MGVKRPLREENLPELSFKQPKQLDISIKTSTFMTHDLPSDVLRIDCAGEPNSNSCKIQFCGRLESGENLCAPTADNELERMRDFVENISKSEQLGDNIKVLCASGSFSSTTTSDEDEEDSGTDTSTFVHTSPGYADISIPCQPPQQYLDPYITLLNSSPSKEVPMGPDHQSDLPNWDPHAYMRDSPAPNNSFLGICVLPMPYPNITGLGENAVGRGRTGCSCRDVGSTRCVRQHVTEARERLRESIGERSFRDLDFYSMGEEAVARNWSADEQRLFHEVVSSSPPSCGRNFWELLSFVLSNRTNKEIVSYYFNVFMQRRRAFQNRSCILDADSDDDENTYGECHGDNDGKVGGGGVNLAYEDFYLVGEVDDEWRCDGYSDVGWIGGHGPRPVNIGGKEEGRGDGDCA